MLGYDRICIHESDRPSTKIVDWVVAASMSSRVSEKNTRALLTRAPAN